MQFLANVKYKDCKNARQGVIIKSTDSDNEYNAALKIKELADKESRGFKRYTLEEIPVTSVALFYSPYIFTDDELIYDDNIIDLGFGNFGKTMYNNYEYFESSYIEYNPSGIAKAYGSYTRFDDDSGKYSVEKKILLFKVDSFLKRRAARRTNLTASDILRSLEEYMILDHSSLNIRKNVFNECYIEMQA